MVQFAAGLLALQVLQVLQLLLLVTPFQDGHRNFNVARARTRALTRIQLAACAQACQEPRELHAPRAACTHLGATALAVDNLL